MSTKKQREINCNEIHRDGSGFFEIMPEFSLHSLVKLDVVYVICLIKQ